MSAVGHLIRATRERRGLSQTALARRAGTSARQVRRIEQGEISPSFRTVERLLAAMGAGLELEVRDAPGGNRSAEELRADFAGLTPVERFEQAARLSETLTSLAARRGDRG